MAGRAPPPPARRAPGPRSVARGASGDPLRENFFALLRRSHELSARGGRTLETYQGVARTLTQMCAEPWVHRTVFPGESELVLSFLRETGIAVRDPRVVVQRSLAGHAMARVYGDALPSFPREEFLSLCAVSGRAHLDAARAEGRGVIIVHTHTLVGELIWNWLEHEGIERGLILWEWTFSKERTEFAAAATRAVEGARELHAAMALLRGGGLVHTMGDGQQGGRRIEIAVHRRLRPYLTGFANLAASAGAPVLSASLVLNAEGRLAISIEPPFPDVRGMPSAQAIEALVREYASRHQRLWQERPGNIPWVHMRQHLGFPAA